MKPTSNNKVILATAICFMASALYASVQTPEDKVLTKGFSAYMDGDDRNARTYFEEVIRINPRNGAAQRGLEKVKVRMKKQEAAGKAKERKLMESKIKEGHGFMKSGDSIAAIDAFHVAWDLDQKNKTVLSELKSIRKSAERIVKHQDFNPSAWAFARGTIAYLDRDWAKAYRIWSERHMIEPANVPLSNATARAENNFKHMMVSEQEDFFRRSARAFYDQGLYQQSMNSWGKVIDLRSEDLEAMEGKARSEEAYLRAMGQGKNSDLQRMLEEGLEQYANQRWTPALETFRKINELDPNFAAAQEYITKINGLVASQQYLPQSGGSNTNWKPEQASNAGNVASVVMPKGMENYSERRRELESQQKRDPSNIKIQQELGKMVKMQDDESERVYKDGLIAYSQGNRMVAMEKWKQVLIMNPDHKKAEAALKKARAEEERTAKDETAQ